MYRFTFFCLFPVLSALGGDPSFQVSLLENDILHVQTSDVGGDFTKELEQAASTNKISGTVLDLRFATGTKDAGLDYFNGQKSPLVILVNGETRDAAAALAEQLRSARKAILIGSTNLPGAVKPDIAVAVAGPAEKEFQKNPFAGLDSSPTGQAGAPNDFLPFIDHTSEADLVRRKVKDGDDLEDPSPAKPEPQPHIIQDPELARAVDLLKALAVLNRSRG